MGQGDLFGIESLQFLGLDVVIMTEMKLTKAFTGV